MIQPNELRIGNLFHPLSDGLIRIPQTAAVLKVHEIQPFHAGSLLHSENPAQNDALHYIRYSDMSPIPLTPEILEKWCGFKGEISTGWHTTCYTAFQTFNTNKFDVFESILEHDVQISVNAYSGWSNIQNLTSDDHGCTPKKQIQYLHQLQNLYFALTGEELPVTIQ